MALAQFAMARRGLEMLIEQVLDPEAPEMSRAAAVTRIDALDVAFEHYRAAHADKLNTVVGDWEPMHELMDNLMRSYLDAKTILTNTVNMIDDIDRDFNRAAEQRAIEAQNEAMRDREPRATRATSLPANYKPEIGTFDGSYEKWPEFHDIFVAEVHDSALPLVRKLQLLRTACIGKAGHVLTQWRLKEENYLPAWQRLCGVYDDRHRIIQAYIGAIFAIKPVPKENHDGLREIIDTVEGNVRQLKAVGLATEAWDPLLIHIILERLPPQTIAGWELTRKVTDVPTLSQLITYLENKARGRINVGVDLAMNKRVERSERRNEAETPVRSSTRVEHRERYRGQRPQPFVAQKRHRDEHSDRRGPVEHQPCPMCQGSHALYKCRAFADISVDERSKKVRDWKRCLNCFSLKHIAFDCQRPGCSSCGNKHNLLVCFKTYGRKRVAEAQTNVVGAKRAKLERGETKREQ